MGGTSLPQRSYEMLNEHEIISLRFFEGKAQMEVADMIGILKAQVSRLEKKALRTMRAYLSA